MEQVFFNVPLAKLEPVFKSWVKDVLRESESFKLTESKTKDELLTIQQAAKFLNLSVATLYSKVSKNELPVMKRSKRLYFSSSELMEYLKAGRKKSNAELEQEAEKYLSSTKKGGRNA